MLAGLSAATSYGTLALGFALLGVGLGLVNPPITNTGVSGMPPSQSGVASAVISATRQFGQVLGVAVMGAMLAGAGVATAGGSSAARSSGSAGSGAGASAYGRLFAAATHAPWWLAVACGVVIAVVGWFTTSPRARRAALAVAGAD
ncbi:MAG TPA: hypothetical protein VGG75_02350 [Trebonia sp.]